MGFFSQQPKPQQPTAPTTPKVTTPRCSMAELFRIVRAAIDPMTFSLTNEQRVRIPQETGHSSSVVSDAENRLHRSLMAAEEARLLIVSGDIATDEGTVFSAILQRDVLSGDGILGVIADDLDGIRRAIESSGGAS